ncbi:MAG: DEAD/DEAH box helicase, partial [Deltaproteobacteria bacterium]|nr:DEAD/DEAH box helicase [Deltaproteobacteria bacterium]
MSIVDEDHTTAEQLPPVAVPVTEPDGPTFASLGLRPEVLQALTEIGFERPTDVQVQAIPLALARRDLLVQSRTGSGKTAAFGLPMCTGLLDDAREEVQALVLAPTRELALQVANECSRFCTHIPLRTVAIYGGAPMGPQVQALKGNAQIVAGTPGRVLDHIRRGTLDPSGIRVLVLDEADEMLSMGFQEEITAILQQLPAERQTMLFSATIPDEIERMIERYLHTPERIYLSEDFVGVREIRHIYYLVTGGDRTRSLLDILSYEKPELALIFCNTREDTGRVADFLSRNGFEAQAISSDLTQKDRERVMERMRQGELHCLVATDIAARGIDIADVTHVFNYTFPESADIYVHRTGRTGRAGRSGTAISLVSPREIGSFYYLKLIHRIFPEERHLPTVEELAARQEGELCQTLAARYEGQAASPAMRSLARRVWSMVDGEALVGRALWELLSGGTATARRRPAPPPPTRAASQPQRADATPVETEGEGEPASRLPSDDRVERSTRPERGGRRGGSDGRRGRGNGRDRGRGGRESGRDGRRGERNGQRPPAEARTDERPDDVGAPRVAPEEEAGLR